MRMRKADSTLRSSRAVPHPSTNRALRRLTSEVRRDPVHSTRYGRQRNYLRALRAPTRFSRRDDSQEFFRPAFISHAILAEEGMPQLQKDAQNICCLCIRIVLYRFRFEGRCRLVPMMDCQRLKLIGRKEKAQPAIAQLVEHLRFRVAGFLTCSTSTELSNQPQPRFNLRLCMACLVPQVTPSELGN